MLKKKSPVISALTGVIRPTNVFTFVHFFPVRDTRIQKKGAKRRKEKAIRAIHLYRRTGLTYRPVNRAQKDPKVSFLEERKRLEKMSKAQTWPDKRDEKSEEAIS